jgi:hypothetical protein
MNNLRRHESIVALCDELMDDGQPIPKEKLKTIAAR